MSAKNIDGQWNKMESTNKQIAYDEASDYLIELLKAYGHRSIIVKHRDDEPVEVMARNFIKKQLMKSGIVFPLNKGLKPISRPFNHSLDREKLTIIFHEALFNLQEAYIDLRCDTPKADNYVNSIYEWINKKYEWIVGHFPAYSKEELDPFPEIPQEVLDQKDEQDEEALENAKQELKDLGVEKIEVITDIHAILWQLAYLHRPITKAMRGAIVELSSDKNLAKKVLAANSKAFNSKITTLVESYVDEKSQEKIEALKQQIENCNESNKNYRRRIDELRQSQAGHKKISKLMFQQLENPTSAIFKTYNLELDKEQYHYLTWFMILKKKVTNGLMKNIVKYWEFSEEALDRFREKVNQYNATITETPEADE